jgi:tetratricopeptide (TPR) repeat protein
VHGSDFLTYCAQSPDEARREPWSFHERRTRAALEQLVHGLRALHMAGKIHRDIKPSNVLVTHEGRVVLLDFGLVMDTDRTDIESLTSSFAGTPLYMAPEQADDAREVTAAADWYAVGAMLYEILTGRAPFEGTVVQVLVAKRSQAPALPGPSGTPIPEDLHELCRGLLAVDPAARPDADAALEMLYAGGGATHAPARTYRHTTSSAFVGRERELATLGEAFATARTHGAQLGLIRGDSGIGKSALIAELLDRLQLSFPDLVVLQSRCYERERIPYRAVDGLIDNLSSYWRRVPSSHAMYMLPREPDLLLSIFPVLSRVPEIASTPATPTVADPQELRSRAFAALRETFQRLGKQLPVVLFIDDMQWADSDTLVLLRELVRGPDAPQLLLLLAARRTTPETALDTLVQANGIASRVIELAPLDDDEARTLAERLTKDSNAALLDAMVREAEGNPFFLHELGRHAQQQSPAAATPRLREALGRRIDELPAETRALMELLAAAGEPITTQAAADALGMPQPTIARCTRSLVVKQLARVAAGSAHSVIEVYHDRVRELVAAGLAEPTLRQLHGGLAQALERATPVPHSRCARHFRLAQQTERAVHHARQAAEAADRELAFDRAAEHYALCLELSTHDDVEVRRRLANALRNAGRGLDAAEQYLSAANSSTPPASIECRRDAMTELLRCGQIERGLAELRTVIGAVDLRFPRGGATVLLSTAASRARLKLRGLDYIERSADAVPPELLARIDVCFATAATTGFAHPVAVYYFQTLLVLFALEAGEPERLARAFAAEAVNRALGGGEKAFRADALLERAQTLAERAGVANTRAFVALMQSTLAFLQGRWARSRDCSDRAERMLREECTGVAWELNTALMWSTLSLFLLGEVGELKRRLPTRLRQAQERRDVYTQTILGVGPSNCCWLADDDPDEARRMIESLMPVWGPDAFYIPHLWELIAHVLIDLYRDEPEAAIERLAARERQLKKSFWMRVQVGRVRLTYSHACAMLRAHARAPNQALLRGAQRIAQQIEREGANWTPPLAALLRAGIAEVRDDRARALRRYREASELLRGVDLHLYARAAGRRHGELLGGDEGAELIREADAWMREQGIRRPDRFAAMLLPGVG